MDTLDERRGVSKGAGTASHLLFQKAFDLIAKKDDVSPPYFIGVVLFGPGVGSDYTWLRSAVPVIDRATGPRCGHIGGFDTPNYGDHFAEFVKGELERDEGRIAAIAKMKGVGTNDFLRARCEDDFVKYLDLASLPFPVIVFLTAGSRRRATLLPLKHEWLVSLHARNRLISVLAEDLAASGIEQAATLLGVGASPERWRERFEQVCMQVSRRVDESLVLSNMEPTSTLGPRAVRQPHPIEAMITLGRGDRMGDNVLHALLDAENFELTGIELRSRGIAGAKDEVDAARNAYNAVKTAYPSIVDYVHLRTGGPRGAAVYLAREPKR